MANSPKLLTDEQVRRYIADGFIVLDAMLPAALHERIATDLHYSLKNESKWLGDNLLPRVPSLDEVLHSDIVHGALVSLLGPEFAWAPHRFPHNSEPLQAEPTTEEFDPFENQPNMGEGSISGSGWHQDGHSKAGRSRWHTFKALNMFYFPHDVPLEMGPTRLLAGTHLYASLRNVERSQVFHQALKAGTVIFADFDLGHAGTPNRTDTSRYMLKFVALRTANPSKPSWDARERSWVTPNSLRTPTNIPRTWEVLWDWLHGGSTDSTCAAQSEDKIPQLLEFMDSADNAERLTAMYELVRIGEPAVAALVNKLLASSGLNRHESPAQDDPGFYAMPLDHKERRFSRRQFVPEDAAIALGLIGEPALPQLTSLLKHPDPWLRINIAYAIGEIGANVSRETSDLVGELLDDEYQQVIRAAADALGWLAYGPSTLERIQKLLTQSRPDWQEGAMGEPRLGGRWTIENQTRYALAWALRNRINHAGRTDLEAQLEAVMLTALPHESGYTPAVLCQGLEMLATPSALKAVIQYLNPRRWDAFSFAPPAERKAA